MGDVVYRPASDELKRISKDVIARLHPDIIEYDVRVVFLFRDKPQTLRGAQCLATCTVVKGLSAVMARVNPPLEEVLLGSGVGQMRRDGGGYFIIQIHDEAWSDLDDHGKHALVHHELCHVGVEEELNKDGVETGRVVLALVPHDREVFNSEISVFGAWAPGIDRLMRTCSPYIKAQLDKLDAEEQAHFDKVRRRGGVFGGEGMPARTHLNVSASLGGLELGSGGAHA